MQFVNVRQIIFSGLLLCTISCQQGKKNSPAAADASADPNMVMIKMLDSIAAGSYEKENPFYPKAQIDYYNTALQDGSKNIYQKTTLEIYKAAAQLSVGQEKEAVALYNKLLNIPGIQNAKFYVQLLKSAALANLRLGERNNCISYRCTASCMFPIQGNGVHKDEAGSQMAIKIYTTVLKMETEDLESRWLLNIACMTLGQYPSKVPPALLIPGLDKDNSGIPFKAFTDIAPMLRLDTKNRSGGSITDDFNNDGYLDIVTSDIGLDGRMHFFKCDPATNGFLDVSVQSGLAAFKGGLNIMQADYNNDGWLDIFVLRGGWQPGKYGKQPNSLLRNNGDGTFTDVTVKSGLLSFHPTQTAVWRDFNNDGWLDVFIGNESTNPNDPQTCELFISNRDSTFTNIAVAAGTDVQAFVKGVASADYNNDGWMDIYISCTDGRRMLLKNEGLQNGKLHFKNVTGAAGLNNINVATFPTWFWDYDNDGWPDIFVCGYQGSNNSMSYAIAADLLGKPTLDASKMYLYHNNHDGTFTDVSKAAGLDKPVFAMGSNFGDVDNDGYLDMYLGTGNPDFKSLFPNKLFKNIAGKKFVDITTVARVGNLQKGHGVSFADMDNDGDQDIHEEMGGAFEGDAFYNSFYLNPGQNKNNWISLLLQGTTSNRSAIGARIKLSFKENGVTRYVFRDVNSGGSFGSSPLRREIGIGQTKIIDEVQITWPSGKQQQFKNVSCCHFFKIKEGNDTIENVSLNQLDFTKNLKDYVECIPMK